jgi:hypothetical protein
MVRGSPCVHHRAWTAASLDCVGCHACCLALTPAAVRAHADVKTYYALAHELEHAVKATAARIIHEAPQLRAAAEELSALGACEIAECTARLAERIDVPQSVRVLASQLHAKALALNPGERGEISGRERGRSGTGVEGWWGIAPQPDNKAHRQA